MVGLTRERVRQIEERGVKRFKIAVGEPVATSLRSALDFLNVTLPDNAYSLSVLADAMIKSLKVPAGFTLPDEAAAYVR